eukprot:GHRQ01036479.1.p2 GENE.GHRQ01036479.1~~GHRQ01036479.1.p2  ORF type:complete len:103 (+),score=12.42 GHRQ01036479.1:634-942(+)
MLHASWLVISADWHCRAVRHGCLRTWGGLMLGAVLHESCGSYAPCNNFARAASTPAVLCRFAPMQMLQKVEGPTSRALQQGVQLGPANVPKAYRVRSGRQLE